MSAPSAADDVLLEPEKNVLPENPEEQQQVIQRSRWQAVLLEAGGIGAAVSEESMRRLKYCLQWLQVGRPLFYLKPLETHHDIDHSSRQHILMARL